MLIEVIDTGRGMTSAELGHLFVPFARLDAARRGIEGNAGGSKATGSDFSVSRTHAEAMGGTIEVASSRGEGSVFTVRLPAPERSGDTYATADPVLAGAL